MLTVVRAKNCQSS